jgi:hypothetical protein
MFIDQTNYILESCTLETGPDIYGDYYHVFSSSVDINHGYNSLEQTIKSLHPGKQMNKII